METIREALDKKRQQLAGKVESLVLCKKELFYALKNGEKMGSGVDDSVYPVTRTIAATEAKYFGVKWYEA